jgi:hypothetical protein
MRHRDVCSQKELAKFDEAALAHELARRGVACDAEPHAHASTKVTREKLVEP